MYNLFEATKGGVAFSSISDKIVLLDIVEEPVEMDTQTVQPALGEGMIRLVNRRKSLRVTLKYMIRDMNVANRAAIRDQVAKWAMTGNDLTVNTRPGKKLSVVCDVAPSQGSSAKWTDELEVVLTAYDVPYWASATSVRHAFETIYAESKAEYYYANVEDIGGNVDNTIVTVAAQNTSADTNLTKIKFMVNETFIQLEGIEVAPGGAVMIGRGFSNEITIRDMATSEDLLKYRTPESSDDLRATITQPNQLIIEADAPLSGHFSIREWWL